MGLHTIPTENAMQTTLASTLSSSETGSMSLTDNWSSQLSGMSATRPVVFCVDRIDSTGEPTPSKREYILGESVSGTTISTLTRGLAGSTQQAHSANAVVEIVVDRTLLSAIQTAILAEHSSTGTHGVITATSINLGSSTTVSSIKDEDNMASDSATALATQQSIKAYVDTKVANVGVRAELTPTSAMFPASNFPQLVIANGTNQGESYLGYDASTDETAFWAITIPAGITITSATLYLTYRMASATSNAVVWACTTKSIADGEAWDSAGTTDTFTADTVPDATTKIGQASKALTTTGWSAGERLYIRISRDADNGSDTATGDAYLQSALLVIL